MWWVIKRAKESKKDVGVEGIGKASKKQERAMQAE